MLAQKAKKPLTLPEELEKIEQQITLTLQEIDHNFNKAHRIVTSSIIPVVERYGNESKTVWEGSKFWKQFFEASANVCLNNYEEPTTTFAEERSSAAHDETTETVTQYESYHTEGDKEMGDKEYYDDEEDASGIMTKDKLRRVNRDEEDDGYEEEYGDTSANVSTNSLLASLNLGESSHKAANRGAQWADIDSPYQQMTKEFTGTGRPVSSRTPKENPSEDAYSLGSSPEEPPGLPPHLQSPSLHALSTPRRGGARRVPASTRNPLTEQTPGYQDPLLHRVLDKNYRIQATPRGKSAPSRYRNLPSATPRRGGGLFSSNVKPQTQERTRGVTFDDDDDFFSSPPDSPAPPELQTQILDSPIHRPSRNANMPTTVTSTTASSRRFQPGDIPRTPSRHNPARAKPPMPHPVSARKMGYEHGMSFDDDDDDELLLSPGFSPPVTIQFSLPQRTILATPARVASKRLVQDILRTAGADESGSTDQASNIGRMRDEQVEDYELDFGDNSSSGQQMRSWRRPAGDPGTRRGLFTEEASPTIIRGRGMNIGDETF